MAHNHEAGHSISSRRRMAIVVGITFVIMVVELVGGIISNSLALLGDAGHMLVDVLALGLSLVAMTMAARPATLTKTYGYHRGEIMAALANGVTLVLVTAFIFYEAYGRFQRPPEVRAPVMLVIATIGLAANLAGMALLGGISHHSLNIKGAFWHILGDTISSVGVIIAAVIIAIRPNWGIVDPIIGVAIGCIILCGGYRAGQGIGGYPYGGGTEQY